MATSGGAVQAYPEKKYGIERFKALGPTVFEGTTDPWLNQIEKCFRVMHYPEGMKLELVTFPLQKGVED